MQALLFSQEDYYPPESFYGGGVGFSQMFLFQNLGELKSFEMLGDKNSFGFDLTKFSSPFILYGGEGFSNITEKIRIGGFVGTNSIMRTKKTTLFLDKNGDGQLNVDNDEQASTYTYDSQAKISLWLSGATIEYLFPVFRGLELSIGSMFGLGRLNLNIAQTAVSPSWQNQFIPAFKLDSTLIEVTDENLDGTITDADLSFYEENKIFSGTSRKLTGSMTSVSGTFMNIQPFLGIKLQLLDRMGLRLTIGFNTGTITEEQWKTENGTPITDSPETVLGSMALRAMMYFGL
ncbi:MAG: hypothetical protein CMG75_02670 [Candidatus Marinimicrobia bacterium]|nr:hypothetical protein [Candidatus Neomarinimicrobiota bacterium]|tara:strand:- start:44791 stop:45660 length:870 start_codon:yes stop_codon:yes gene_type:complete